MPFNINPRKDSHGFEIVDDYFPDSGSCYKVFVRCRTDKTKKKNDNKNYLASHLHLTTFVNLIIFLNVL